MIYSFITLNIILFMAKFIMKPTTNLTTELSLQSYSTWKRRDKKVWQTHRQTDRQTYTSPIEATALRAWPKNQRGIIHTQTNLWVIYNFHSPLSSCSIIENYSIHLSPGCLWVLGWVIPVACVCNVCVMIYTHFKLYLFTNCILCANAAPISQCTLYTWWIYIYSTGSVPYAIVWREPITCTYVPM